jgi:predicted oxidoreductase
VVRRCSLTSTAGNIVTRNHVVSLFNRSNTLFYLNKSVVGFLNNDSVIEYCHVSMFSSVHINDSRKLRVRVKQWSCLQIDFGENVHNGGKIDNKVILFIVIIMKFKIKAR